MIYKNIFLKKQDNYKKYVEEQNIVANCELDQTARINYDKYLNQNIKNILDIGCRNGKFINRYNKLYNVYGIDIGENSYKRAVNVYGKEFADKHIIIQDIQDENILEHFNIKFDFINFSHVIEHLLNPSNALNNIKKLMNINSKMLIIIPADIPRFKNINAAIKGQPYHEIFWEDKQDIISFIESNDLFIIEIEEFNIGKIDGEWRVLVELNSNYNFNKYTQLHSKTYTPQKFNINAYK